MALTRDSLGIGETASVERQETDAILADPDTMAAIREGEAELTERGARRADFPAGTHVRTRSPLVDDELGSDTVVRTFDVGYVREDYLEPDEFVSVSWSQAGCGCNTARENPAELVKITEVEYNLFVSGYNAGYNAGYDNARPTAS